MKGPPLGPGGEDITWSNQVDPQGQKASSTRKNQTSNLKPQISIPASFISDSITVCYVQVCDGA